MDIEVSARIDIEKVNLDYPILKELDLDNAKIKFKLTFIKGKNEVVYHIQDRAVSGVVSDNCFGTELTTLVDTVLLKEKIIPLPKHGTVIRMCSYQLDKVSESKQNAINSAIEHELEDKEIPLFACGQFAKEIKNDGIFAIGHSLVDIDNKLAAAIFLSAVPNGQISVFNELYLTPVFEVYGDKIKRLLMFKVSNNPQDIRELYNTCI